MAAACGTHGSGTPEAWTKNTKLESTIFKAMGIAEIGDTAFRDGEIKEARKREIQGFYKKGKRTERRLRIGP